MMIVREIEMRGFGILFLTFLFLAPFSRGQIVVRGETVYTMAGKVIKNGVVLIKGNKIERILEGAMVKLPEGYKIMNAKVVTPGLVDAHSVVGLAGIYNQKHDQMRRDRFKK